MHLTQNKNLNVDHNQYLREINDNNSDDGLFDNQEFHVEKKLRRGKIEKRRRDRINNSLAELKELVPNAMVKQNTTKLEKAEILKLAVDHLKELKYRDSCVGYFEYRKIYESKISGFRDCLNEVGKYFQREGITNQNSIYSGLMEHLQCLYQSIITKTYYREEVHSNIPSSNYNNIEKSVENTILPNLNNSYQKLSSWNHFFPLSYANQNSQHPTQACNYQPNFLFQLNAHQQSNQYLTNIPQKPLISTNQEFGYEFQYPSESDKLVPNNLQDNSSTQASSLCNEPLNFINTLQSTD